MTKSVEFSSPTLGLASLKKARVVDWSRTAVFLDFVLELVEQMALY